MDVACANLQQVPQHHLGKHWAKSMLSINKWWVHAWAQSPCWSTEILTFFRLPGASQLLKLEDHSLWGPFENNKGHTYSVSSTSILLCKIPAGLGICYPNRKPTLHDWKMLRKAKCHYLNNGEVRRPEAKANHCCCRETQIYHCVLSQKRPKFIFRTFNE